MEHMAKESTLRKKVRNILPWLEFLYLQLVTKDCKTGDIDVTKIKWATLENVDAYQPTLLLKLQEGKGNAVDKVNEFNAAIGWFHAWEANNSLTVLGISRETLKTEKIKRLLQVAKNKTKAKKAQLTTDKSRMADIQAKTWTTASQKLVYATISSESLLKNVRDFMSRARTLAQIAVQYTVYQRGQTF